MPLEQTKVIAESALTQFDIQGYFVDQRACALTREAFVNGEFPFAIPPPKP
jgi:hypothetical protein